MTRKLWDEFKRDNKEITDVSETKKENPYQEAIVKATMLSSF